MNIQEHLTEFYRRCEVGDKLTILQDYADIVIIHLSQQEQFIQRESFNKDFTIQPKDWKHCFVCGKRNRLARHHIIQIQYGGTNCSMNLVWLCDHCHAEVHPWLKTEKVKQSMKAYMSQVRKMQRESKKNGRVLAPSIVEKQQQIKRDAGELSKMAHDYIRKNYINNPKKGVVKHCARVHVKQNQSKEKWMEFIKKQVVVWNLKTKVKESDYVI